VPREASARTARDLSSDRDDPKLVVIARRT